MNCLSTMAYPVAVTRLCSNGHTRPANNGRLPQWTDTLQSRNWHLMSKTRDK